MAQAAGGISTVGGLVSATNQPTTYIFTWGGTAPTTPAVTIASLATAYATSTAYKVGDVIKGADADGACWGCVKAGTSASGGSGPAKATLTAAVAGTVGTVALVCGINLPTVIDGTTAWVRLSGPSVVQNVVVSNRDTTNLLLDIGSTSGLATGKGACVPANGHGPWSVDGGSPELIYVVAGVALAASFVVHV